MQAAKIEAKTQLIAIRNNSAIRTQGEFVVHNAQVKHRTQRGQSAWTF